MQYQFGIQNHGYISFLKILNIFPNIFQHFLTFNIEMVPAAEPHSSNFNIPYLEEMSQLKD